MRWGQPTDRLLFVQATSVAVTVPVLISMMAAVSNAAEPVIDFNRDVRPILSNNCFFCHGQDGAHREADLRLDNREGATRDLGGRAAVVPGKPDQSELIRRIISTRDDELMPPAKSNKHLTAEQQQTLRTWIQQGAKYEKHWSFIPPRKVAIPDNQNPIDYFVQARLRREGLQSVGPAAPEIWLRRVTLDLTGLPPTPAEVAGFLDAVQRLGEVAYGETVDRLLASPHYGERMAQDWLDVARYADTHGFNNDSARTMWRWRDWVIDAFNQNLPYNQFVTEQLAGDLLPDPKLEQLIATGFCRNHVINSEGGIIDEEYRVEYVADRVRTMSTAWLGLSMECCRCHDHKFDPLTSKDYYSLFAFFNNVPEHGEDGRVANAVPLIQAPTREQQGQLNAQRQTLAILDAELSAIRNRDGSAATNPPLNPPVSSAVAAISLTCDDQNPIEGLFKFVKQPPELVDGVIGKAWSFAGDTAVAEFAGGKLPLSKRITISFWLKPDAANPTNVALLSNTTYDGEKSQQGYAKGFEIRLIDGEIEVRANHFFPAYAVRLASAGAAIQPGQWRQVTVITGEIKKAADTRIYLDGAELPTRITYDDLAYSDYATGTPFFWGADRSQQSTAFKGAMDEFRLYESALESAEIANLFKSAALPYVQQKEVAANPLESAWLRDARLLASDERFAELSRQRAALWEQHLALMRSSPETMVMQEMAQPRPTFVLTRGVYNAPGEAVSANVPEGVIAPWPANAPRNRLGLARWLTGPDHPLTARVVVNRYWAQFFGTGIVKTLEDFGSQGEFPSHPELLDWLARDFVDQGWNTKRLMKLIVLSGVYRQSPRVSAELLARDPDNRLMARSSRLRLPAEIVRDQALALSGLLKERIGGPSVFPYQPDGLYNGLVVGADYPGTRWEVSLGDDLFRRSMYTFWKRTVPHPVMTTFDVPDREFCTVRRSRTNTPLQALILLNEPAFHEAAVRLGQRIETEGGSSDETRLDWGFRLVTARPPSSREMSELKQALEKARQGGTHNAYAVLGGILLNLDETVTRE